MFLCYCLRMLDVVCGAVVVFVLRCLLVEFVLFVGCWLLVV